ncbi:MAG: hypothetical protein A2X94_12110 [Bdellovibrionales bacterium GWB1_55_8]|nr:MAG: hypothetical protein A2X94_12110 [Bdellovibrionales bacterium GWB1_55_8]
MFSVILPLTSSQKAFLREIAQKVTPFEEQIAADWATAYRQAFREERESQPPADRFKKQVRLFLTSLSEGNFEDYFERIARAGFELAQNRVSYEGLILSFHLYEEAATPHLHRLFPARFGEAISILDHLYHNVIAILARAYFSELEHEREKVIHIVAHDLRIPLTGILLGAQAIARGESAPQRQRELAEMITRAGKSMSELIDRMLEYGKLKSGKFTPRLERLDLIDLAAETAQVHLPVAAARRLAVKLNGVFPESWNSLAPIWIKADRQLISRAIGNYLSNAIKYASAQVELVVSEKGDQVEISVQDDGPGIAPDQRCRVFEDYYVSPEKSKGGTGLGLPSVRMIAELHGGKYDVQSQPQQGSTFILKLPREKPQAKIA